MTLFCMTVVEKEGNEFYYAFFSIMNIWKFGRRISLEYCFFKSIRQRLEDSIIFCCCHEILDPVCGFMVGTFFLSLKLDRNFYFAYVPTYLIVFASLLSSILEWNYNKLITVNEKRKAWGLDWTDLLITSNRDDEYNAKQQQAASK